MNTVTKQDAFRVAAYFAYAAGRPGPSWRPNVAEFPECFVVWAVPNGESVAAPGTGVRTVIDKATACLVTYPAAAPEAIRQHHLTQPPQPRRAADQFAALRRLGNRVATPSTAAHLTVADGVPHRATGAKGDQVVRHHPLVVDWLTGHEPGDLVRGTYRHAELIVVSDWLYAMDHAAELSDAAPVGLDQVRDAATALSTVEVVYIREDGDPLAGAPADPCDSCLRAWVHFGIAPAEALRADDLFYPAIEVHPELGHLPPDVGVALTAGGFGQPVVAGDRVLSQAEWAQFAITALAEDFGHAPLEALRACLERYPCISVLRRAPGVTHRLRPFELAPDLAERTALTLADFAQVIGAPLAPVGAEAGGDSIIAIDARGMVFVLDQAGEWFAGQDIDAALTALIQGRRLARVRDDGSLELAEEA